MNIFAVVGFIMLGFFIGLVTIAILGANGDDEPICRCGEELDELESGHYMCPRCK